MLPAPRKLTFQDFLLVHDHTRRIQSPRTNAGKSQVPVPRGEAKKKKILMLACIAVNLVITLYNAQQKTKIALRRQVILEHHHSSPSPSNLDPCTCNTQHKLTVSCHACPLDGNFLAAFLAAELHLPLTWLQTPLLAKPLNRSQPAQITHITSLVSLLIYGSHQEAVIFDSSDVPVVLVHH